MTIFVPAIEDGELMARQQVTRGILPHWYQPGAYHFVTYRLAGSLSPSILASLSRRKEKMIAAIQNDEIQGDALRVIHKKLFAEYDSQLDAGSSDNWLGDDRVAKIVRDSLEFVHRNLAFVNCYCIMSNHVHVLLRIAESESSGVGAIPTEMIGEGDDPRNPLTKVMQSHKKFTALLANRVLGRSGTFWQHESYDHWVRDEDELERIVLYIIGNPVKVDLVRDPHEWKWSSARDRFEWDGDKRGWLPDEYVWSPSNESNQP